MTDLETVQRLYRAERNKAAVDKACRVFAGVFMFLLLAGFSYAFWSEALR